MSSQRIYLSPPDVGDEERAALLAAFDGGWIAPVGPDLDAFEREIAATAGTAAAVGLSSGTAALHLALVTAGVRPGDDVLVSSFTFAATANAVVYAGANPVFIDSERETWNMSPQLLADELAERAARNALPAAVVIVDLYGQCANYGEIVPICARYEVPLIEDAAEALGATWDGQNAGSFGHAAVFSFNGNKIITTSGGGMLVTDDLELAQRVKYLSTQARQPVPHYEHTELGYNYRLSNLLAAMGRAQLARLPMLIGRRLDIRRQYERLLGDLDAIEFMPLHPKGNANGWLTCVLFDDPASHERVRLALEAENIESRPLWKPMHLQPYYSACSSRIDGTSEELFARGLCLPTGGTLGPDDVALVARTLLSSLRNGRPQRHSEVARESLPLYGRSERS